MDDGTFLPTATQVFRRKRVHMAGDPTDLIAHLRDLDSRKKDYLASDPLTRIQTRRVGSEKATKEVPVVVLEKVDGEEDVYPFMDKAIGDLSSRYRVGTHYARRMADIAAPLFATNFNWWLERSNDKTLWRTFDGQVRAVLSKVFRIFDNSDVALHALKAALGHSMKYNEERGLFHPDTGEPMNTVELFGWEADADGLNMWLVDTTVTAHLPTMDLDPNVDRYVNGPLRGTYMGEQYEENGTVERMAHPQGRDTTSTGTMVFPIVEIRNHESGGGALKVTPGCAIACCSNVAKVGMDFARIHRGADMSKNAEAILSHSTRRKFNEAIYSMVEDGVRSCFDPKLFRETVEKLKGLMEVELTDAAKAVSVVCKSENLTEDEEKSILAAFAPKVHPQKVTAYCVAMAVTDAAQGFSGEKLTDLQDTVAPWVENSDKARSYFGGLLVK